MEVWLIIVMLYDRLVESSTEIYTEDADAFGTSRKETK